MIQVPTLGTQAKKEQFNLKGSIMKEIVKQTLNKIENWQKE